VTDARIAALEAENAALKETGHSLKKLRPTNRKTNNPQQEKEPTPFGVGRPPLDERFYDAKLNG
jgi:hypothetical protein